LNHWDLQLPRFELKSSTLYEKLMRNYDMRLVWVVIPLVLIGIVGVQESFAEEFEFVASPRHQLESGITPENIQCREDRVLVLRNNGNPACVKESTSEKLDWKIIKSNSNIIEVKSKQDSIPSDSLTVKNTEIIDANNQFAFEFYSQIKDDENIFYSPWSIMTAFAIVNEGARENTAEEMQSVFGFSSNDTQRQNEFKSVNDELNQEDSSIFFQDWTHSTWRVSINSRYCLIAVSHALKKLSVFGLD